MTTTVMDLGTELIGRARALAAERGLDGFDVDDLCAAAGVDRDRFERTFASKEDAVLGFPIARSGRAAAVRFVTGGDGMANDLGPRLLDELMAMAVERWGAISEQQASLGDLATVLRREPAFLEAVLARLEEQERFDVRLIVQREDLATDDPRAEAASLVMGTLVRRTAREVLRGEVDGTFAAVLRARVVAARAFFVSQDALGAAA